MDELDEVDEVDEVDEIKDIILTLTDKDTGGIILSFLFPLCIVCKKMDTEENLLDTFDNKHICHKCYRDNKTKICNNCRKVYLLYDGIFCRACHSNCSIYCANCLKDEYKVSTDDNVDDLLC